MSLKDPEAPDVRRRRPRRRSCQPCSRPTRDGAADTPPASTRVRTPRSTRVASWPSWPATRARSATAATRTAAPASTSSTSRTRGTRRSSATTWVPAGHTATCINDCRYLWSVGPANNGSHVNGQPQDVAGVLHPGVDGRPGLRHRRARSDPPVHVRQAGRHEAQQQHDGVHALRRRRPGRHRLDVGLRRRARLLHQRPASRPDDGHRPLRDGDRSGPVRRRQRAVLESDAQYGTISVEHNSYHRTQAASDTSPKTVTTADGRDAQQDRPAVRHAGERHVSCTSTSGGGSGRFVDREPRRQLRRQGWDPTWTPRTRPSATSSRSSTTTRRRTSRVEQRRQLLGALVHGASATWSRSLLRPGHARPRRVRPDDIKQAGYIRIPAVAASRRQPGPAANNTSAAYWHNGYIYVADYTRGIDVLRYTDPIKGVVQPKVCWNACDK